MILAIAAVAVFVILVLVFRLKETEKVLDTDNTDTKEDK